MAQHKLVALALVLVSIVVLTAPGCRTAEKPAEKDAAAEAAADAAAKAAPPPVVDWSMTPEAFAQAVAEADLLEISLGKFVQQNGDTPTVKDFAQRMVVNHTAIQVIITKIAAKQGIALPTGLNAVDEATVAKFADMRGIELDKAYMTLMAEKNPKTLAMFRWQYDNCSDPGLKPFAMQTMPIVATHARVAEALNAEVNKEELRIAAEQKAAELKAAEQRKAEEAAAAALAAAKKPAAKRAPTKKSPTTARPATAEPKAP